MRKGKGYSKNIPRLFFIHGYGGSPEDERFAPALMELEKKGFSVNAITMPETDHPRKDAWVGALRESIGEPDRETFLMGFSLGCITILRYLEELGRERCVMVRRIAGPALRGSAQSLAPQGDKPAMPRTITASEEHYVLGSALLLSGFFEDLGPDFTELRSFIDMPVDWSAVKCSCGVFSVVHGDDDPLVPLPFAERLAKNLGVQLQVEHAIGHFNTAYGVQRAGEVIGEWGKAVSP